MRRRSLLALAAPFAVALPGSPLAWATGKKRRAAAHAVKSRPVKWLVSGRPNVLALGAVVIDLETRRELFSRKPDLARPIASISKLAAAMVFIDKRIDITDVTTISAADAETAKGGAPSRLLTGMTVSNLDLFHAALLGSDNRAIPALGRAGGMSPAELTAAMNRKVADLGLTATHFREPTGLARENVSTPRETLAMLEAAMAEPKLAEILSKVHYDAHPISRPAIRYINTYRPAIRPNAHVIGGKTGYNDFARYCLVIAATVSGKRFGMTFLGSEGKLTRFGDFARVTDWIVAFKPHEKAAT